MKAAAVSALAEFDDSVQSGGALRGVQKSTGERRKKEGLACIYMGRERLAHARARAARVAGGNLSALVCNLIDTGIDIPPDAMVKIRTMALLRGITAAKLMAEIVTRAVAV